MLVYCASYFAASAAGLGRFSAVLVAFAGAMLGLVVADDMLLMFIFWELTTVFSYLLIGHYADRKASRRAAMQAIVITTGGGLAMLVGVIILGDAAGTYRLSELLADPPAGTAVTVAAVLLLVGAITKSALIPLHFWLPAAMAAHPRECPARGSDGQGGRVPRGPLRPASASSAVAHDVVALGLGRFVGGYRALPERPPRARLRHGLPPASRVPRGPGQQAALRASR